MKFAPELASNWDLAQVQRDFKNLVLDYRSRVDIERVYIFYIKIIYFHSSFLQKLRLAPNTRECSHDVLMFI